MRIVIVSDWFADKMGYSENLLPRALAKLSTDVHLVTSDLQPNFANYKEAYEPFLGPRVQATGIFELNGYTLHRLPHLFETPNHAVYIAGLHRTLAKLRPDIVQCFTLISWSSYQATLSKILLGYKLFFEEHTHLSVFTIPQKLKSRLYFLVYKNVVGPFESIVSERCYPVAPDAADIAINYFGYAARKTQVCSLGVDTDRFTPVSSPNHAENRAALRNKLGFAPTDIVCLYSGRFSPDKNPQCLAQAIDQLQAQYRAFRGLFIGSGSVNEVATIEACKGCVVHPFVDWTDLPDFYRAADIGVWPKQESTSQLDAAASGLPIIISNRVQARERVDGNGLVYEENDTNDLARQLLQLQNAEIRHQMGSRGTQKVRDNFSWDSIAKQRLQDYGASLSRQ